MGVVLSWIFSMLIGTWDEVGECYLGIACALRYAPGFRDAHRGAHVELIFRLGRVLRLLSGRLVWGAALFEDGIGSGLGLDVEWRSCRFGSSASLYLIFLMLTSGRERVHYYYGIPTLFHTLLIPIKAFGHFSLELPDTSG